MIGHHLIKPTMPIPCVMSVDRKGNRFDTIHAWFQKLDEEVREARRAYYDRDGVLADEIADFITVGFSMLNMIGLDEDDRSDLFERINRKNKSRGYHDKGRDCSIRADE